MRSDARANRAAILDSALALYAADPDTPYSAIAAGAGVGIATLYRHFPTPDDLVVGLVGHIRDRVVEICDRRLPQFRADPESAWRGWAADVAAIRLGVLIPMLARGRDLDDLPPAVLAYRGEVLGAIGAVLDAAKDAGLVRREHAPLRIQVGLGVLSRPLPDVARREFPDLDEWLLDVYLRGLRPDAGDTDRAGRVSPRARP